MNVDEILEEIDEMLENSRAFPLAAHKVVIDGDRLRELVSDIRLKLPEEIKHAKLVVYDRDRYLNEARQEAEEIVRAAEARAKSMVAESAILEETKRKAHELLAKTKTKCDETKEATAAYVLQSLTNTEAQIASMLTQIQQERRNWDTNK